MSHNLLKGKRGIIFGALNDMSIAWKVAERAVEEGATITLSNTPTRNTNTRIHQYFASQSIRYSSLSARQATSCSIIR